MEKSQAESNLSITNINNDMNIELNKEFLTELQSNAYYGIHHEHVVDHIAMVLKKLDLINFLGVDSHRLRMKVFSLSLANDARQWWINEEEGKITTWKELVEKFFCKFYPESYDGEEEMLDEGNNRGMIHLNSYHDILSSNDTIADSFFKPYLNIQEKNKIDEQGQTKRKYSYTSNSNNEQPRKSVCKAEKFEVIKYSFGPNEEHIAIRRCEYDALERNKENGKSANTPIDTEKPLLKDPDDIMFAACACAHFQVTPKASHVHAVKRIFRYLKGKLHLGLWYPKDSPFNLVAYSDSNYAGASLDRKSTSGGCQFLSCRLIYWQCKKQTVVATSSTEAEYVAAVLKYYGFKISCLTMGVNIPRCDEDRLELMELTVFLLPKIGKVRIRVSTVDLQVSTVRHMLLLSIKYALTVNPNIYVSCIKQFWTIVAVKKVNDVIRLQALVDKKKVVVTEATIREALHLDDAEGVECLSNEEIFAEFA
nr:uncharacterized mitochondrial protein AtMg00810-like [Tanacetum cinerariifolium]